MLICTCYKRCTYLLISSTSFLIDGFQSPHQSSRLELPWPDRKFMNQTTPSLLIAHCPKSLFVRPSSLGKMSYVWSDS